MKKRKMKLEKDEVVVYGEKYCIAENPLEKMTVEEILARFYAMGRRGFRMESSTINMAVKEIKGLMTEPTPKNFNDTALIMLAYIAVFALLILIAKISFAI